ncbi:hypothetical protein BGX30_013145 [Mortierella sp. GBA39]|nr:hypothetical protein BGX30_013145 [Mortierella sp. GBA39]
MERSNQQSTDIPSSTRATAMRAGVQNPSGSNYQVAGPTIGGTATSYNPDNIEVAKEHLPDSLGRASLDDNTTTTTTTGTTTTTHGTDSTLKDQVISGASTVAHTAADVTMTVAAGAAAAGAATVSAVKSFLAGDKTAADHSNPASTTAHTAMDATNKSQPIADFPNTQVHNMHDDSTPETPTRIHTHAATGPIHSVPVDFEPIHSTGLDSTASMADYRAKQADLHPTTKLNQGHNTHHSTSDIDARPSASDIDARPTTASATTMDSRPLTEKVTAPIVGAAAAMGTAAAGTAAYLGNKDSVKETANNLTTPSASSATPSSDSSYATMDSSKGYYNPSAKGTSDNNNTYSTSTPMNTPAVKTPAYTTASDATPAAAFADPMIQTTTSAINPVTKAEEIKASPITPVTEPAITSSSTLGSYQTKATTTNPFSSPDSPNVTTSSSRPMTEKVSAPVLGAAALGTAAYLGNKATATDANNSTKMFTPSANNAQTTTSYNPTNTSSYNTPNTAPTSYTTSSNTAPTSYTTSPNTTIPAYEKSTATKTYPSTSATAAAPIMAAASLPYMSNTSANTTTPQSSTTPNELKSADTTAAAIPASYHGSIPQAGPGEEVVWVKTVTTTDYYDDGTPTGRADVVDRHQEAIDPRAYATVKDGEKVYDNNDDQHMHQQEHKDQDGAGRHL